MFLKNACMRDNLRVYAIGDIHGCIHELKSLLVKIDDFENLFPSEKSKLIFLGDYVDRGPANREVIEYQISLSKSGKNCVFLKGNHDQRFEDFCKSPNKFGDEFMRWGGGPTLRDYGVIPHAGESYCKIAERLHKKMPAEHMEFLQNLEYSCTEGDFFFCHAGVRPGVQLRDQRNHDLMWIRNDFIYESTPYEKVIVHGHTMCDEPEVLENRINIDTGCYHSGRLTAVVLEGNSQKFIHT